jgi:hypothetical protein
MHSESQVARRQFEGHFDALTGLTPAVYANRQAEMKIRKRKPERSTSRKITKKTHKQS